MLVVQDDEAAMNFVTSAANLRAFAFFIPLKSKFDIKCKSTKPVVVVMSLASSSSSVV